jgi:pyruvate,water dikinase
MRSNLSSGIEELDRLIDGLVPGDNLVWQVDDLRDYSRFAQTFADRAIADGHGCTYLRFAPGAPMLESRAGLNVVEVDPGPGFDTFSGKVHSVIEERGQNACYVFDNLSSLVTEWATDELLASFFQIICPFVLEQRSIAYFALTRGQHSHGTIARIRDTTQILIDVYHVGGTVYLHPLKVLGRYSPHMFLPHRVSETGWTPVFQSGEAAAVSSKAWKRKLPAATDSVAPWQSVYAKLAEYHRESAGAPPTPEVASLKHELSRMLIGDQEALEALADKYLTLDDLLDIRSRMIGSGRIGGKAAGMLLARRILLSDKGIVDFSQVMEAHDSFYIGSDVFFSFLVDNNLFGKRLQITKERQISREAFEQVERQFVNGEFSPEIMGQFRDMLDYFGQAPIIIRSSSLLEDSYRTAFAGKYRSEFCANQGGPDDRMKSFLRVLKLVYASALNPDAIAYRSRQGLMNKDEQMAILVQRVSGTHYKDYFFPSLAGVAFSKNLYAWTGRIDPRKGMIRLVFGLGTRAVNRTAGDYSRMIAVSHPQLRPETGPTIWKYSQRNLDMINLRSNRFETLPFTTVVSDCDHPNLHLVASIMSDGYLSDITGACPPESVRSLVLTFDNMIRRTSFIAVMDEMLTTLEKAYGYPVDTEFTAHFHAKGEVRLNLLQCRPLTVPGATGPVTVPDGISSEHTLFRSGSFTRGGIVRDVRYVLYLDPRAYSRMPIEAKKDLGWVVGRINNHPSIVEGKIVMMGPARWGSSSKELGVNVGYSDICNASVLVEVAWEETGHVPEVSYGTHFFQDLVEAQIMYMPVYPKDPDARFNTEFFSQSPNVLSSLFPDMSDFGEVVYLIDVPSSANGLHAQVVADPYSRKAICFLG